MVCFPCGSKGTVGHPTDGLQATGCFSAHEKNRVCLNASVSSETVSPDRSRFVSAIECGCASNRCGSQPPGCGEPQKYATAHCCISPPAAPEVPFGQQVALPSRIRASSPGVYLLFALSSLRERLSCSLRLPPLPLHGYPCGLLPLIPLLRFPPRYF